MAPPRLRPILLKGHERSITSLKFNHDGDLLFTCSKHLSCAVWYTSNGERLGTFEGHNGVVWSLDIDRNTEHLLSGSGDNTAKLWDAELGREIGTWNHKSPVRDVNFALGDEQFLSVTDQVMGYFPTINIWDVHQNPRDARPVLEIAGKNEGKIMRAQWGPLNKTIFSANEDGTVRIYDTRKAGEVQTLQAHTKSVQEVKFNKDKTMFITASKDGTAKLFDTDTFEQLKVYYTGRPINTVSISPTKEEVLIGGGQPAETVTTTRVDQSQFRVKFFHMIFEEEIGSVAGHFGPVNVLSYSPDGSGFATGGEDGYVRMHHFDERYKKFGTEV